MYIIWKSVCFIPIWLNITNHSPTVLLNKSYSPQLINNLSKNSALTEFSKSSQNVVVKYESCPAQCPADVLIFSRNIPEVLWSSFGLAYPCCSGEGFLEVTRRFAQAAGLGGGVLMMSLGKPLPDTHPTPCDLLFIMQDTAS